MCNAVAAASGIVVHPFTPAVPLGTEAAVKLTRMLLAESDLEVLNRGPAYRCLPYGGKSVPGMNTDITVPMFRRLCHRRRRHCRIISDAPDGVSGRLPSPKVRNKFTLWLSEGDAP